MVKTALGIAVLAAALGGCAGPSTLLEDITPRVAAAEFRNVADRPLFIRARPGHEGEELWRSSIVLLEPGSTASVWIVVPQPGRAKPVADVYYDEIVSGSTSLPLEFRAAAPDPNRPRVYRLGIGPDGIPTPMPDPPASRAD